MALTSAAENQGKARLWDRRRTQTVTREEDILALGWLEGCSFTSRAPSLVPSPALSGYQLLTHSPGIHLVTKGGEFTPFKGFPVNNLKCYSFKRYLYFYRYYYFTSGSTRTSTPLLVVIIILTIRRLLLSYCKVDISHRLFYSPQVFSPTQTPTLPQGAPVGSRSPDKIPHSGTSLVAQWLRIRLPMQGTRVQALVQEDPTCRAATKPSRHKY